MPKLNFKGKTRRFVSKTTPWVCTHKTRKKDGCGKPAVIGCDNNGLGACEEHVPWFVRTTDFQDNYGGFFFNNTPKENDGKTPAAIMRVREYVTNFLHKRGMRIIRQLATSSGYLIGVESDGSISVGCQTVDAETVDELWRRSCKARGKEVE